MVRRSTRNRNSRRRPNTKVRDTDRTKSVAQLRKQAAAINRASAPSWRLMRKPALLAYIKRNGRKPPRSNANIGRIRRRKATRRSTRRRR